jgi:hypothetical protein
MKKSILQAGSKVGEWKLVESVRRSVPVKRCSCGTKRYVIATNLNLGLSMSCGCKMRGNQPDRGVLVTIGGVKNNLAYWGAKLGLTRERARQLHEAGLLRGRVKNADKLEKV